MKVLELFGGIGACSKALERLGIDYEIVDYVEIDKYAVKSFNAMHSTDFEPQDICTWDKNLEVDLIMHGSPCQDFSVAGKQAGGDIDSGTRSSLMYETIRIVGKLRPKYVIWENVKNLLSKKHIHNFDNYLDTLKILGYHSYYKVLDAKDFGVPQHRERIYTISVRNDIKDNFTFPEKEILKLRLRDILEDEVDRKFFLSNEQLCRIKTSTYIQNQRRIQEKDYCDTLCARDWKDPKCVVVGNLDIKGHDCIKRVYSENGISPTLTDMQGGNRQPKVMIDIEELEYQEYLEHLKEFEKNDFKMEMPELGIAVRKLTPKECWRLMGFDDADFDKAAKVNSNTQLYKQAGNSIVVNVLEKIFNNLLK